MALSSEYQQLDRKHLVEKDSGRVVEIYFH